jgi:bifunctional non-homologous end joining protein LigD
MARRPSATAATGPAGLPALEPMLATAAPLPPDEDRWAAEVKWDGARTLAYVPGDGSVRFVSRGGIDVTATYPELGILATLLHPKLRAVLDGEVLAFGPDGRPSFSRLQRRMGLRRPGAERLREVPVTLVLFDVLILAGESAMKLPYTARRELLQHLELAAPRVVVPPYWTGRGQEALSWTREHQLEGIVAKRLDSPYAAGKRSPSWVKVKNLTSMDVLIGGWVPGGPSGTTVRSLLLGVADPSGLRFVASAGDFSAREARRLAALLTPLEVQHRPFTAGGVPRSLGPVRWVRPELTGEVEYLEETSGGQLRHPIWRGLRAQGDTPPY